MTDTSISSAQPFFSIGVTTYDRVEMLIETLHSVLDQTFADFEIIVGNDNPARQLTPEFLKLHDARVRIVNHERNLGELGNMNELVRLSRGRYFTWMADDDLLSPHFLEVMRDALTTFDFPACAFTSFILGDHVTVNNHRSPSEMHAFTGAEFLRRYWNGELQAIGTMGMFARDYLERTGGLEDVSGGNIALHTEYLHLVKLGLLERIVYIDEPLVIYRVHEGSWGCSNNNFERYKQSGANLARLSIAYLTMPQLKDDFDQNLTQLLKWLMGEYVAVARRTLGFGFRQMISYFRWSRIYISKLKGSRLYSRAVQCLIRAEVWLCWSLCKQKFLALAPQGMVRLAYSARSAVQRDGASSVSQVKI